MGRHRFRAMKRWPDRPDSPFCVLDRFDRRRVWTQRRCREFQRHGRTGFAQKVSLDAPDLSANEVEKILLTTATPSADLTVNRYVNAFAAVRAVLGTPAWS